MFYGDAFISVRAHVEDILRQYEESNYIQTIVGSPSSVRIYQVYKHCFHY